MIATKKCPRCKVIKSLDDSFTKGSCRCRQCNSETNKNYHTLNRARNIARMASRHEVHRAEILANNKNNRVINGDTIRQKENERRRANVKRIAAFKAGPCTDCGNTFPSICMEFDHIDGQKTKCIAQMLNSSETVLLAELSHCELVCSCCHRSRTRSRQHQRELSASTLSWIIDELKEQPCEACGVSFSTECMDFDHIDPTTKSMKISSLRNLSAINNLHVLLSEVAKCRLLCANCHRLENGWEKHDPA